MQKSMIFLVAVALLLLSVFANASGMSTSRIGERSSLSVDDMAAICSACLRKFRKQL